MEFIIFFALVPIGVSNQSWSTSNLYYLTAKVTKRL